MKQQKIVLPVDGMFCPHCETRIHDALSGLSGVLEVQASYARNRVSVRYDPEKVTLAEIRACICNAGYGVRTEAGTVEIVSILVILLSAYVIVSSLGWTRYLNLFPRIETSLGLAALFVTGLLTSVHCVAMCGGINLTQTALAARGETSLLLSNISYHLGRLISYTAVGALAGGLGRVLSVGGKLKGTVACLAGLFMAIMALNMLGLFRNRIRLPQLQSPWICRKAAAMVKSRSSFLIGILNGFMPCGPLQSVQLYALSTGSILSGAASMFLFCVGTIPLLLAFGLCAGKLNRKYTKTMLTVSACLILLMGMQMISNGLTLSGYSSPRVLTEPVAFAVTNGDVQTVLTEIDYGSYPPISVIKNIPVKWTITVPEGKLNGCNGELLIPAYGIDVVLHEGDNQIDFLPSEAGTIPYSCWMGMIRSRIEVTEQRNGENL